MLVCASLHACSRVPILVDKSMPYSTWILNKTKCVRACVCVRMFVIGGVGGNTAFLVWRQKILKINQLDRLLLLPGQAYTS